MSVSLFQSAVGMFGYMTDLHTVDETATETIEADGSCHRKCIYKLSLSLCRSRPPVIAVQIPRRVSFPLLSRTIFYSQGEQLTLLMTQHMLFLLNLHTYRIVIRGLKSHTSIERRSQSRPRGKHSVLPHSSGELCSLQIWRNI